MADAIFFWRFCTRHEVLQRWRYEFTERHDPVLTRETWALSVYYEAIFGISQWTRKSLLKLIPMMNFFKGSTKKRPLEKRAAEVLTLSWAPSNSHCAIPSTHLVNVLKHYNFVVLQEFYYLFPVLKHIVLHIKALVVLEEYLFSKGLGHERGYEEKSNLSLEMNY